MVRGGLLWPDVNMQAVARSDIGIRSHMGLRMSSFAPELTPISG